MTMEPQVTVDTRARALTIDLEEGRVARTVEFDAAHLVDLDEGGRVLSIEVLSLDNLRLEEIADRFGLQSRLPAIRAALRGKIPVATATSAYALAGVVGAYASPSFQIVSHGMTTSSGNVERPRDVDLDVVPS